MIFHLSILVFQTNGEQPYSFPVLSCFCNGLLKVTIQIVKSNQGFAALTTVYPVQERNTWWTITIGHIDECHYVSTTAFQSNASISMCNELMNDTWSSRNKHFIMSICSFFLCHQIIHLLGFFNTTGSPWTCMFVLNLWEV